MLLAMDFEVGSNISKTILLPSVTELTNLYICKKLTLSQQLRYGTGTFFIFGNRVAPKIGRGRLKGYI
jgi:hypothetical protein